jgi:hypothetical protein
MLLGYDLHEVARYMGYKHGAQPSEIICELIDEAYEELCKVIEPKFIFKKYDFLRTDEGITVNGIEFRSRKLLNHLKDSTSLILFSATLGKGVDDLIHKYSADDIAMAAVTQAVSSSLVENLCDIACEELKTQIKGEHRPRFSPGYGDLHLSVQKDFFKLLPVNEKLGIQLTESFMMKPTKTVTAFIGVTKE